MPRHRKRSGRRDDGVFMVFCINGLIKLIFVAIKFKDTYSGEFTFPPQVIFYQVITENQNAWLKKGLVPL
jgi:hypothetical protein